MKLLKGYISRETLAAQLGKTVKTIIRWEKKGEGPPVTRIGRDALYRNEAIEQWLLEREGR